jgi:outer membrane lipoprotein-sorting protein
MNVKIISSVCLTLALTAAGLTARAADGPAAADIVKQSLAKYASLTSYSDEGVAVATLGTTIASSYTFTLKLARTNLYQVVWRLPDGEETPKGVVWSAGEGNFVWMGKGFAPVKYKDRETAIASATGISGGVAASVPATFFNLPWGGLLRAHQADFTRAADDKVGDVDCFVLTNSADGRSIAVWIGKQDQLIHQVENDTSGKAVRAMLEAQAQKNLQIRAMLDASSDQVVQDVKSVETHRNIVVDPKLTEDDFHFQAGAGGKN